MIYARFKLQSPVKSCAFHTQPPRSVQYQDFFILNYHHDWKTGDKIIFFTRIPFSFFMLKQSEGNFFFYGEFWIWFSSRFFPSSVKTYGKTIQKLFSHCVKFSDLSYLCMSGDFFVLFEWRKKKFRRIFPDFISMCEMEWKKFRRTFFSHIWRQVKKVEFDWQCLTICDNVKKKMESVFYKKKKKCQVKCYEKKK